MYLAANNSGCWKLRAQGFNVGWMFSPGNFKYPVRPTGETMPYAVDNGLYHAPDAEPKPASYRWGIVSVLSRIVYERLPAPLFAVVPDCPYDGETSRRVSGEWLPRMRELFPDIPLAVAVQDGMTHADLDGYDWCAVAGSTRWKLDTLHGWVDAAKERGMKTHCLRANTRQRIEFVQDAGCDSSDGTGIWRGGRQQKRGVLEALCQSRLFEQATN